MSTPLALLKVCIMFAVQSYSFNRNHFSISNAFSNLEMNDDNLVDDQSEIGLTIDCSSETDDNDIMINFAKDTRESVLLIFIPTDLLNSKINHFSNNSIFR